MKQISTLLFVQLYMHTITKKNDFLLHFLFKIEVEPLHACSFSPVFIPALGL